MSETTPTMVPDRDEVTRVLEDTFWPFLAHSPNNPDIFWGQATDAVLGLFDRNKDVNTLSDTQKRLMDLYGGTVVEKVARQISLLDDPDRDPDFEPVVLAGLPWWTMKIPKVLKLLPLLKETWQDGYTSGNSNAMMSMSDETNAPVTFNPYELTTQ